MSRVVALVCLAAALGVASASSMSPSIRPQPDLWSAAERAQLPEWCNSSPTRAVFAPECGGFIGGIVWSGVPTNCSFVLLDNETDKTRVVDAVNVCNDHRHTTKRAHRRAANGGPAAEAQASRAEGFTAFDNPTKQILYATGDGSYVYGVNVNGQGSKTLASLPARYAPLLGLAVANGMGSDGQWYVVTQTDLLLIDPTTSSTSSVMALSSLGLSTATRITAYNCSLYAIDGLRVHTIDLLSLTSASVTIADTSLASSLTINFWPTNNTLTVVSSERVIVQISLESGQSWPILALPAGSGAVDRVSSFFDMYFCTDSASMYLVNLSARKLETVAAWPGANTKSNIQYYY